MSDFAAVKTETMNDIAQAIIEKGGAEGPMFPKDMAEGIRTLAASSAPQFTEAQTAALNSGATKAKIDSLSSFVKTVNGTAPDGNGNVQVATGGGGGLTGHTLTVNISNGTGIYPSTSYGTLQYVTADGVVHRYAYDYSSSTTSYQNVVLYCVYPYAYYPPQISENVIALSDGAMNLVLKDMTITIGTKSPCLLKGTKITLADRSEKNIEDLTYDDELLVWNFDEGKLDKAKTAWLKKAQTADYMFENTYTSGKKLLTTGQSKTGWGHRHFDATRNEFRYTPTTVGDQVYTLDGLDEHVSCEKKHGEFEYYNLYTEKHFNCFANGILTSGSLNNLYKIENMKFTEEPRNNGIKLEDLPENLRRYYEPLRISEAKMTLEEVVKYVENMESLAK